MTWQQKIAELIHEAIGFDPAAVGPSTLEHLASAGMARTGAKDASEYADRLRLDASEMENLIEDLVVPETWFFRDIEPFVFLPRWARETWRPAHPGARLRVLSAPCSTGEEPYSAAIALLEAGFGSGEFRVDAVDISRRALDAARAARFGRNSFRSSWPALDTSRYFAAEGTGFRLSEEVVRQVEFRRANLLSPELSAGQEPYDVIFCRNVLIYLAESARRTLLSTLDRLLAPDGVLFCGHSEVLVLLQNGYESAPHPRAFACRRGKPAVPRLVEQVRNPSEGARPRSRAVPPRRIVAAVLEGAGPAASPDLLKQARNLADRGALEAADALCERVLRQNDSHAEAHFLRGLVRAAAGRLDEAERSLRGALYLRPDHYEATVQMSLLYERKGDLERARVFKQRSQRLAEVAEP